MKVSLIAALCIAPFALCVALADTPVSVQGSAAGPLAIVGCSNSGNERRTIVFNHTAFTLRAFTERWTATDSSGKILGTQPIDYDVNPPLASGHSTGYQNSVPTDAFSSGSPVAHYACKLLSATFGNGSRWSPGNQWHGKLVAVHPAGGPSPQGQSAGSNAHNIRFTVVNAWNDFGSDGNFVHDTILIQGGNQDVTIKPTDFVLRAILSNGGLQEPIALATAAPSYDKELPTLVGTPSPIWVPEVAPASDLGALGSLIVPAHGTVKVTLTFVLQSPLKDPKANRDVFMP